MRPTDNPSSDTDIAIIGSGYTGLCAARILRKNGASVTVFERNTIGWGASSRNGGMATPGLKQGIQKIYKMYGSKLAHEFWKASVDAIDLIEEIVDEHSIDCDWYVCVGGVVVVCGYDGYIQLLYVCLV